MPKEIGVGVLGYSIGRVHAHAWNNVSEVYHPLQLVPKLVALYGRTKSVVDFEAEKYGYARTYDDWEKVVKDEQVEVVDNCLPVSLHPEPMIAAAKMGKKLFSEKPLARRAKDAKKMLDAAEKAKVPHMVGYNYRFIPAVAAARQMIADGTIGKVLHFKGSYLTTNSGYDSPETTMRWQFQSDVSGYGALSDLGTHALDLARYLVGEVSAVASAQSTYIGERPVAGSPGKKGKVDVDDLTVAAMKFKNGALGTLDTSWLMPGRMDYLTFEVYGSKGALSYNLERINELGVYLTEQNPGSSGLRSVNVMTKESPYVKQYWPNQGGGFGWDHTFVNEFHHYLSSINEGTPIGPQGATFLDGYRNCLIMDAIAESARSQKWVQVPQ